VTDDRTRDALVAGLGLAMLGCGVALWGGYTLVFAWGVSLCLTLALALGALRDGSLGPFRPWVYAALLAWAVAFLLMHALSADATRLVLGLPPATGASVFLLWPAPLVLVTLPYALYFERHILSREAAQAFQDTEEGRR
jgi:hypothetical protein